MREIAALRNENEQLKGGGHAAGIQTPARPGNAQHSPPTTMTPAAGTGLITPQLQPFGQLDMAKTGLVRLAEPYVQGGWRQYEVSGEDSDLQRQAKALLNKWSRESLFGNDQDCWETTATTRSTPTSGASCRRRMSSVAGLQVQVLACVAPRAHRDGLKVCRDSCVLSFLYDFCLLHSRRGRGLARSLTSLSLELARMMPHPDVPAERAPSGPGPLRFASPSPSPILL